MNRHAILTVSILLCAAASVASGSPQIGDKAPAIKVAKWVTQRPPALPGEPKAEKHVFLVEFWATWCQPCLQSIPHLAELHKKHEKDGLVVISISNEEPELIETFIRKKQKMPQFVGSDDEMATTTAWTKDIPTIPHAFVVDRKGIVAWEGNPLADVGAMDTAIKEVLAGTYDIAEAKRTAETAKEYGRLMSELQPAYAMRDEDKLFKLLDRMIELRPGELQPYLIKRGMLREFDKGGQRTEAWNAKILEAFADSAVAMRQIAEFELRKDITDRDAEFMFRSAMRAKELSGQDDADVLQVVAGVYSALGMLDAAIASQEKAVAGAPADRKETFQKVLSYYMTARKLARQQQASDGGG
jgi:thiol-disulfide isomerase/thioredoxin